MADVMEPAGVIALLDACQEEELVGTEELDWLDYKGSPYRLAERREQWELAKDVAALANAEGGIIVLGVQTDRPAGRDEEVAARVVPFPAAMFNPKQVRDVISAHVYPRIEVEIRTFDRDAGKRLAAIVVRKQGDDRRPFLLTHVFNEENRWEAMAMPVRSGTHTAFEPPGMLHRDIADGRRARRVASPGAETPPVDTQLDISPGDGEEWSRTAAEELAVEIGWSEYAVVALTAVPSGRRRRPDDFYARDGLRTSFAYEKQLRQAGFGISYAHDVRVGDQEITSLDADRTVVRIRASGHVIAACAGTAEFLGWASDRGHVPQDGDMPPLRINPVALNEWVYEFCRFVYREIFPRWGDSSWALTAVVLRAKSGRRPLRLPRYLRTSPPSAALDAESDDRVESLQVSGDEAVDAIRLLSIVYGVFGLGPDALPFQHQGRFDEAALLDLR